MTPSDPTRSRNIFGTQPGPADPMAGWSSIPSQATWPGGGGGMFGGMLGGLDSSSFFNTQPNQQVSPSAIFPTSPTPPTPTQMNYSSSPMQQTMQVAPQSMQATPQMMQPGSMPGQLSPDQVMAGNVSDVNYLRGIASNAGYPVDASQAWQSMVAAQQRNLQENFSNLNENFNNADMRFSTAYGTAATDYWNQASKDQNSLLGQMTMQSQENARQRELQAAGMLGGFANQNLGQLSGQDFQSQMQQYGVGANMASQMFGAGTNSASLLAQLAAQGAGGLSQAGMYGAGQLFGGQNSAVQQMAQQPFMWNQLGLQGAQGLGSLGQSNLGLGNQLGMGQYNLGQNQIGNAYQEWLRQQPQYNPMLNMVAGLGTFYPPMYYPGYQQGQFGSILGGLGSLYGGLGLMGV
jgi:hypothetical protein